jgi:hypothetical protein
MAKLKSRKYLILSQWFSNKIAEINKVEHTSNSFREGQKLPGGQTQKARSVAEGSVPFNYFALRVSI